MTSMDPLLEQAFRNVQNRKDAAGLPDVVADPGVDLVELQEVRGVLAGTDLRVRDVEPVALTVGAATIPSIVRGGADELVQGIAGAWLDGLIVGLELARLRAAADRRRPRAPYVSAGADGARRSATIDREELATLADDDARRPTLEQSAAAWDAQAERLERIAAIVKEEALAATAWGATIDEAGRASANRVLEELDR